MPADYLSHSSKQRECEVPVSFGSRSTLFLRTRPDPNNKAGFLDAKDEARLPGRQKSQGMPLFYNLAGDRRVRAGTRTAWKAHPVAGTLNTRHSRSRAPLSVNWHNWRQELRAARDRAGSYAGH